MRVRRARIYGLDDHGRHARVNVLGGSLAAVGCGSRQSLLEIGGSDKSEPRQVIFIGSQDREAVIVGLCHSSKDLLFCRRDGLGIGTSKEREEILGVSEGQNGKYGKGFWEMRALGWSERKQSDLEGKTIKGHRGSYADPGHCGVWGFSSAFLQTLYSFIYVFLFLYFFF